MKLCLTIGVSKAPPLSYLPGAITAAHEMGDWARRAGFITEVVTDEGEVPVTIQRVRKVLLEMLPSNDEVELFVLHFAGHGLRHGAEQNLWLPSDWYVESRAISVEGLKRRLYRHGIGSLTIFGDACRSLPTNIGIADIADDPVLPRGPYEERIPIIDRFNAVVDGQQAYMLRADGKAPDRCVFSTVLIEGLCGFKDEAFDKYLTDSVIPESLALFSAARLQEIGETYDLRFTPDCTTGIPRDHTIYFQRGNGDHGLKAPRWPEPKFAVHDRKRAGDGLMLSYSDSKEWLRHRQAALLKEYFQKSLYLRKRGDASPFNLCIRGAKPKAIWSTSSVDERWKWQELACYQIRDKKGGVSQVLVEFEDGVFASAVVYPMLVTVMVRAEKDQISWTCVSRWDPSLDSLDESIATIVDLQAGNLAADRVDGIAAQLRVSKHINPTLGAIASYLYDYAGDIDSIRRMAFFYCQHQQAMPFDVAFMGLLPITDSGGHFVTEVPRVRGRPHAAAKEQLPEWVTRATRSTAGKVAGLWPWLRQGWQFVENPEFEEKVAAGGLRDVAHFLLPSQFSSFKEDGAQILIRKFGLEEKK